MRKFFALIGIVLILLTGCGPAQIFPQPTLDQPPLPSPKPSSEWSITLSQSGGIAGINRSLEVHSDGSLIASEERSGNSVKRQLTNDELSKINQLLKSFSYRSPTTPMGCADCFFFALEIKSAEKTVNVKTDEANINGTGAEALISYLAALMNSVLTNG